MNHDGNGILRAGPAKTSPETEDIDHLIAAREQLTRAESLLYTLQYLKNAPPQASFTCTFLAGWVLEFTLKAYLVHKKLGTRYTHDLDSLWKEAANIDLPISAAPPDWCHLLTLVHNGPDFYMRYAGERKAKRKGDKVVDTRKTGHLAPNLAQVVADLQTIVDGVKIIVTRPYDIVLDAEKNSRM